MPPDDFASLFAYNRSLVYVDSVLRWIDGLDGHHDHGSLLWNVGHGFFLVGFVLFAEGASPPSSTAQPHRSTSSILT